MEITQEDKRGHQQS